MELLLKKGGRRKDTYKAEFFGNLLEFVFCLKNLVILQIKESLWRNEHFLFTPQMKFVVVQVKPLWLSRLQSTNSDRSMAVYKRGDDCKCLQCQAEDNGV